MSCKHVENFLSVRTNFVAVDAVLRFVVFPISEKAIKYKVCMLCCLYTYLLPKTSVGVMHGNQGLGSYLPLCLFYINEGD